MRATMSSSCLFTLALAGLAACQQGPAAGDGSAGATRRTVPGSQAEPSAPPPDSLLPSGSPPPAPNGDQTLRGDYVHPRLSPDGRYLAFAQVLVADSSENTQLLLLRLSDGRLDTLMDSAHAGRYGYYKAFVSNVEWTALDTVAFTVADGDVGWTTLWMSPGSHDVARKASGQGDDEQDTLPAAEGSLLRALAERFPSVPQDALMGSLQNGSYVLADSTVILQFNYVGMGTDVWTFDLRTGRRRLLLAAASGGTSFLGFGGGAPRGSSAAIAVRRDRHDRLGHRSAVADVYTYSADGLVRVDTVPATVQTPFISTRRAARSATYFLLQAHETYQRGENPAYRFDGKRVERIRRYPEISDFDVSADEGTAVFCHWIGSERVLSIVRTWK